MSCCEYCPWCCVYISWDSIKGASLFGQHYFQISSKFFQKWQKVCILCIEKNASISQTGAILQINIEKNLLFPIFFKIISKNGIVKPGKLLWLNGKASKNK